MPYKDPAKARERDRIYRATRNRKKLDAFEAARRSGDRLFINHGLRPEYWAAMWEAQGGCCYLCGDEMTGRVVVDHDHGCCPDRNSCSFCRRGLACDSCNVLIGYALDDPDRLERIAANLRPVLAATRARIATKPLQGQLPA